VTPEAARFLDKARQCLADAVLYQPLVPRIAGREAYLAAFHAAEALLHDRTGKIAKTHRSILCCELTSCAAARAPREVFPGNLDVLKLARGAAGDGDNGHRNARRGLGLACRIERSQ